MEDNMIINISEIDEETLTFLRLNVEGNFENKTNQILLGKHLLRTFPVLSNEIISKFTQLTPKKIEELCA